MLRHLFHKIYGVFRPNEEADTDRKYTIYLKKLGQGDGDCSTRKTVLGWNLDTVTHLLNIPPRQKSKVEVALTATTRTAHTMSLRKWGKLPGLLRLITPAVAGYRGMFTQV